MEEWKEYRLEEICTKITDGSHFSPQACQTGYPMFSVKDMLEYGFDYSNCKYISEKDFESMKSGDCVPQKGDILVAKDGSFLKQIFECKETKEEAILSSIAIFRPNQNIITPTFLCYLLKSPKVYNYIALNCVSGSALPRIVLKDFKKVTMQVPPLPTQQKIAAILSSLDDKIELNNKINTNLEQQAQALFKNWFVDFDPFGGKMPEGWKVGKLGEFVEIKRGGSPRPIQKFLSDEGYRWLKISDVTSLSAPFVLNIAEHIKEEGLSKTVFLKAGSLVLSNSATPGIPKILDLDTCIHDGWLYFPKSQLSNEYLYLLFKEIRPQLVNLGNGSIFTNLKTDILKNFEISLPSTETLSKFQNIIKPIFEKVLATQREIKHLETLRDTLLPKLMNGEIEI